MPSLYQVRLYNTNGVLQAVFDDWNSLAIEHRTNGFSTHQLSINGKDSRRDLFTKDSLVEVLRKVADYSWYQEYIGFHRTPQRQITSSGRELFTSYGRGLLDLLHRRSILYFSGTAGASKTGASETVMKEFVYENIGAGATSPPRISDGVFPNFIVQPDFARGAIWTGSRSKQNLLDVLQEISSVAELVLSVNRITATTFEFRCDLPIDRTNRNVNIHTGLNAAGYSPVIFAPELANMANPSLTQSATEEVTKVIVFGQGQESDRAFVERTSNTIADSPWNLIESSRDARQEESIAGLNAEADGYLKDGRAQESFTCEIVQTDRSKYGVHYFPNDLVTVRFGSVQRRRQIMNVNITVSQGKETINITLGEIC